MKKALAIALILALCLTFMPVMALADEEEPVTITSLSFTLNNNTCFYSTRLSPNQVIDLLKNSFTTSNEEIYIDWGCTKVCRYFPDEEAIENKYAEVDMYEHVFKPASQYFIRVNLEENDGFVWDEEKLPSVTINGEDATYIDWYSEETRNPEGSIDFYMPIVLDETSDYVFSLTIKTADYSYVQRGKSRQIEWETDGTSDEAICSLKADQELKPNTTITNDGLLTVDEEETAETVEVTVASKVNPAVFETITICLGDGAAGEVSEFHFTEEEYTCKYGEGLYLPGMTVLVGNVAPVITYSLDTASDYLSIDEYNYFRCEADETAKEVTITATVVDNPEYKISTVIHFTEPSRITSVDLSFTDKLDVLVEGGSIEDIETVLQEKIDLNTKGVFVDINSCRLIYFDEFGDKRYAAETGEISKDNEYFFALNLEEDTDPETGEPYYWNRFILPEVSVDGKTDYKVDWYSENNVGSQGSVDVYIPLTFKEGPELGDVNEDNFIDLKDILLLRKHVAKMEVTLNLTAADTNNDGELDLKDVLSLRKYVASGTWN